MTKKHTNIRETFLLSTALTVAGLLLAPSAADAKYTAKNIFHKIDHSKIDARKCQEPFPEPFPEAFREPFPEPFPEALHEPFPEPCPDVYPK